MTVSVHLCLTYSLTQVLIPHLLNKGKRMLFIVATLVVVYVAFVLYEAMRVFYFLPSFPEVYRYRPPLVFIDRITDVFAFLNSITSLVFPAIILMVFEYFQHQKEVLKLREQKKNSELEALKNQLNPHFLFNTLNNLYLLTLEKSDQAPEVIRKLSEILDYVLFRCKEAYVLLGNEIGLIQNYLSLEQLRYGKRLDVRFEYSVIPEVKIAPLLILTLVENAFKHGVSQEINKAFVNISVEVTPKRIEIEVSNSLPQIRSDKKTQKERESLGYKNIKNQLELLYPNAHELRVEEVGKQYCVQLNLDLR